VCFQWACSSAQFAWHLDGIMLAGEIRTGFSAAEDLSLCRNSRCGDKRPAGWVSLHAPLKLDGSTMIKE